MAQNIEREQTVVLRWRTRIGCEALGPTLERAFPTGQGECFDEAMKAIDDAESAVWSDGKPAEQPTE